MTTNVSDARSNPNDQIDHAVKVIGRSKHRATVFRAIYFGKQKLKTVDDIVAKTGLPRIRVLQEAQKLSSNEIVPQTRHHGQTAYGKDKFYAVQKGKILSYVENPRKLKNLATKTRPRVAGTRTEVIRLKAQSFQISQVTVDDLETFSKVNKVAPSVGTLVPMAEKQFKAGIMRILGEKGEFQDWGGEKKRSLHNARAVPRKAQNYGICL